MLEGTEHWTEAEASALEISSRRCPTTAQQYLAGAEDVDEESAHDEGPLAPQCRLQQLALRVGPFVLGLHRGQQM